MSTSARKRQNPTSRAEFDCVRCFLLLLVDTDSVELQNRRSQRTLDPLVLEFSTAGVSWVLCLRSRAWSWLVMSNGWEPSLPSSGDVGGTQMTEPPPCQLSPARGGYRVVP